ncbi:MAG: twin-arginine translocase TatA/TatE family subunit [Chitinivibrionales bacterium]|nr:twin-arginine translocase TatA/TatE family subunit [Chitinivibrionales bacterium]
MFPGGWEWVLIGGIIVLLFGAKKIPELASGLGKGIKEFKKAQKDVEEIEDSSDKKGERDPKESDG